MRYELKRDLSNLPGLLLLYGAAVALWILGIVLTGFNVWILALPPVLGGLLSLINEVVYRFSNYLILHERHLDVRQVYWAQGSAGAGRESHTHTSSGSVSSTIPISKSYTPASV